LFLATVAAAAREALFRSLAATMAARSAALWVRRLSAKIAPTSMPSAAQAMIIRKLVAPMIAMLPRSSRMKRLSLMRIAAISIPSARDRSRAHDGR
jgi:hypothetical protein